MNKIFILMGKSATGKDTIFQILKKESNLDLKTIIGYTTRPIRMGEKEGVEYFFVSIEKLEEMRANNQIIEQRTYDTMHGKWHYFTANDGQFDLENNNYLLIGTLDTYEQIRTYFGEEKVIPIYIEVEDGLRLSRAINREREEKNPRYEEMCRRFLADASDFTNEKLLQLGITKQYDNRDINQCVKRVVSDLLVLLEKDK